MHNIIGKDIDVISMKKMPGGSKEDMLENL